MTSDRFLKILICDDDADVHIITKIALKGFDFDGCRLDFYDCFSGEEARRCLEENPDMALILLDLVMEHNRAGLELVDWIRREWKNRLIRIIIRTGMPGEVVEADIIRRYDINDYRVKTDLTPQKLYTTLYSSLRARQELCRLEEVKEDLKNSIRMGARFFMVQDLDELLETLLDQVGRSVEPGFSLSHGFLLTGRGFPLEVAAACGRFKALRGLRLDTMEGQGKLWVQIREALGAGLEPGRVLFLPSGLVTCLRLGGEGGQGILFIEGNPEKLQGPRIRQFFTYLGFSVGHFHHIRGARRQREELIFQAGDLLERTPGESPGHLKRTSQLMAEMARLQGWSADRVEEVRMASTLHDAGKLMVPPSILTKKGPLDGPERELVRGHSLAGWELLGRYPGPLFKTAAAVALGHHEHWDGTGYPHGLRAQEIPLEARMMCLADVMESLCRERGYARPCSPGQLLEVLRPMNAVRFDPELFRLVEEHQGVFLKILADGPV